jgi:FMN phosphatase YigB (HAD superfamily)
MRNAKLYDWSGVLVSVDGFRTWLREERSDLFFEHYDWDESRGIATLKKRPSQEVLDLFEEATTRGLYQLKLLQNVQERLSRDSVEGYVRVAFTSVPRAILGPQLQDLGVANYLDEIVTVEDLNQIFRTTLAKEDPLLFQYLNDHVRTRGLNPVVYVDDSIKRIEAAVQANNNLPEEWMKIARLYLFDQKKAPGGEEGYQRVNDLLLVR